MQPNQHCHSKHCASILGIHDARLSALESAWVSNSGLTWTWADVLNGKLAIIIVRVASPGGRCL